MARSNRMIQVRKIAEEVRQWAEKEGRKDKYLFPDDLCGMCAIAAGKLWRELTKAHIPAQIAYAEHFGDGHCFVMVGRYIVDVTASQFGHDKVVIRVMNKGLSFYWQPTKMFRSVTALRREQKNDGWPREQIV